jgi:hypothetical protein
MGKVERNDYSRKKLNKRLKGKKGGIPSLRENT